MDVVGHFPGLKPRLRFCSLRQESPGYGFLCAINRQIGRAHV